MTAPAPCYCREVTLPVGALTVYMDGRYHQPTRCYDDTADDLGEPLDPHEAAMHEWAKGLGGGRWAS